jgi:hypothetical protein
MYARGHLLDLYGLEVSPDLVSTITDAVLETAPNGKIGRSRRCIR